MSKHRKSWSETEKATVLQHYHEHVISATSRKFDVASSMIYRWITKSNQTLNSFDSKGVSMAEYNRILRENQALK